MLDEVLEHEPALWHMALQRCTQDTELQTAVESLLARCHRIDGFIDRPAALKMRVLEEIKTSPPSLAGRLVGRYRLVREIGRGGMGLVWLGVPGDDPDGERVAVKLMYPWVASADVIRRFEQERRILQTLDHPNIARLVAASVTDDGQACMILEFVDGRPIDVYCNEHRLGIQDRLALVRTVAKALGHAHDYQVVHCDLKPSNVLVTASGEVKLVDFGIAKVLAQADGASSRLRTSSGQRWVTPSHAAPEQLRGGPVNFATDIYQLGVLLYELLTERRPFDGSSGESQLRRAVLEAEPERPSRAILRADTMESLVRTGGARTARRSRRHNAQGLAQGSSTTLSKRR